MPLKISPSKKPLLVAKRSSMRNRWYEVEPATGRKVYPSRKYSAPNHPPPLSDEEAAYLQTSCSSSRYVLRHDPAQSLFEIAPDISGEVNPLLLSDPSQSHSEMARGQSLDDQLSSQLTTSLHSARASRNVVVAPLSVDVCNDVMIISPPASSACTSISVDATTIPVSAVTPSISAVDNNSSVGLPTSVVDSTSVLSNQSSDVNTTSVGESGTMVNPISGLLTLLTEQQQQYIVQATVDAMSLTSEVLARRNLSHGSDSVRSLNLLLRKQNCLRNCARSRERLLKSFARRFLLSPYSR